MGSTSVTMHARAHAAQRVRAALAHVAVAADHRDLARHHHVGRALDAVGQRLAAAVEIVELALGHRVVHVDGRNQQLALLHHLVEPVHAGRRLFARRRATPWPPCASAACLRRNTFFSRSLITCSSWLPDGVVDPLVAVFQLIALVDQQRHVAAVVHDQLRPLAALVRERLIGALPVLFQRLALPREHRNARRRNRRRRVVLRGEDVAARPAHFRAQAHQRLNQHRGLNGHVQRAGHAHAGQRLLRRVLVADRHQARHLLLGDGDLLAAPVGQGHDRPLCTSKSVTSSG